ncbi:hypothetical protein [Pseudomonas sp. NPDC089569]|uniref:hypothetical protein n=1 Tax=Pseudomonas sp. NPDC089569 TaxID=3390722 RepID=UPI003CFCAA3D
MHKTFRRSHVLLIALALASFTTAAFAAEEVVMPAHEIYPDLRLGVSLVGVNGCRYVGTLSSEEQPNADGFLARLGQHVMDTVGDGPLQNWTLTLQRKQCGDGIIETVNGTINLGEMLQPIPAGTLMKVTLRSS